MKHLVKSFGNECCFSPTDKFEKTVSVSYDSVEHDPDAEVKVFVHNEHSAVNPYTIPSVLNNYESFDLILSWSDELKHCLLYTSPSPRDGLLSRMPSSA